MKILVTGGASFIGSAVVRHIIRDTQDAVINLDSWQPGILGRCIDK